MTNPLVEAILDSIGSRESGGSYTARNPSGEPSYGKYQFMPATWDEASREYLASIGEKPGKLLPTPQNQDAVARYRVTKFVDEGLNPVQIYMKWASGQSIPKKFIGKSQWGQAYDLNEYASDFSQRFEKNFSKRMKESALPLNPSDIENTSNIQGQAQGPDWQKVLADYKAGKLDEGLSGAFVDGIKSGQIPIDEKELAPVGEEVKASTIVPTEKQSGPDWNRVAEDYKKGVLPPEMKDAYEQGLADGTIPSEAQNATWEEPTQFLENSSTATNAGNAISKMAGGGPLSKAAGIGVEGLIQRPGETIGGMLGGLAGGHPLVRSAGAAIGGGIGAVIDQIRKLSTITDPAEYARELQRAKEMVAAGAATQGVGQLVGEGVTGLANKLLAPSKRVFRTATGPSERDFRPYVQDAMPRGSKDVAGYSLGQRINSGLIGGIEEFTEKSVLGSSRMSDYRLAQREGLNKMTNDLADTLYQDSLGRIPDSGLGRHVLDFAEQRRSTFAKGGSLLYGRLDAEVSQRTSPNNPSVGMVDLTKIKADALKLKDLSEKRAKIGATAAGDAFIDKILKLPDQITFMEAHALRSGAYTEVSNYTDRSLGRREVTSFTDKVSNAMEQAAVRLGGDVLPLWQVADGFWKRQVKERFDTKYLLRLKNRLDEAPISALQELYNPKNSDGLLQFYKMIGKGPDATKIRNTLEAKFVEDLLTQTTSSSTDNLMGNTIKKRIESYPEEYLNEVFSGGKLDNVMRVVNAARSIQRRDPMLSPSGKMIILGSQGLALFHTGRDAMEGKGAVPFAATAGTIIIAPKILAKMLLSPTISKLVAEGLLSKPISPRLPGIISKLSAEAIRTASEENGGSVGGLYDKQPELKVE